MKLELPTLALKIFKICYEHSIHLDIEWVPRDRKPERTLLPNWWISMTGRSPRMSSKTWIVSGVPIKWIVLPRITKKKIARYFSRYVGHRCIYAAVGSVEFLVGSAGLSYSQSSCLYVCSGSQGHPRCSTVEVSRVLAPVDQCSLQFHPRFKSFINVSSF